MLKILSDTEKAIVETIRMRLSTEQALQYLKDNKLSVSRSTYFRHKMRLEEKKLERLYHIANIGFEDQHLQRIDGLELIEKKMWEEYNKEKESFKRVQILKDIAQIQPYLSAYCEATKYVVDKRIIETKEEEEMILELKNKDTPALTDNNNNNPQVKNNIPAISVNKEINSTPKSDKDYNNLNDTSFIDKMISETTDPKIIAQLEKQKRNCVF